MKSNAGRPVILQDHDEVRIGSNPDKTLQRVSVRRAIVDFVVDKGGRATVGDINKKFKFECRTRIMSLIKVGWLQVSDKEEAACQ
jgi:hypothetical protein